MLAPASTALAHGAWLGLPQIRFTPATDSQIATNIANGNPAIVSGDVIELVAEFPSIVSGTLSGPNGYFTFYVPGGTEVVGASVVDAGFNNIPVRRATSAVTGEGISRGWGPQGQRTFDVTINGWNPAILPAGCASAATCNSGLAHLYGDTGIFYSTRADTAFYTGDGSDRASLANGYRISPSNSTPWSSLGGSGDARIHNKWDAVQSNAFGSNGPLANPGFSTAESTRINTSGRGTTPYKAGSPVAGPDAGNTLDRYGTTGPWQRISYSGSCYAQDGIDGPANGDGSASPQPVNNTPTSIAVCTPTASGYPLSEASPLPSSTGNRTNAVRYAIGGIDANTTYRIKIRLRASNPALIKAFNAEAAGGDSTQGAKAGNDNPWRYFVGGTGVVAPGYSGLLAITKKIVAVNGQAYAAGSTIPPNSTVRYRITYGNSGLTAHTNVQLSDVLPSQSTATSNYTVVSGSNVIPASPPASGTVTFLPIANLDIGQGGAIEFDVALTAAVGQSVTNQARVASTQHPTALVSSVGATVAAINANLQIQKTSSLLDPLNQGKLHLPEEVVVYSIKLRNLGDAISGNSLVIVDRLPAGLAFSRFPFDAATAEPLKFVDGAGAAASGVACCSAAQIQYSSDNGSTYAYLPPTSSFDPALTHIKIAPAGSMNAGTTTPTEFTILLKSKIQ